MIGTLDSANKKGPRRSLTRVSIRSGIQPTTPTRLITTTIILNILFNPKNLCATLATTFDLRQPIIWQLFKFRPPSYKRDYDPHSLLCKVAGLKP